MFTNDNELFQYMLELKSDDEFYSFGMMMLETAANIVVPAQYVPFRSMIHYFPSRNFLFDPYLRPCFS